jgi:hypothetical protein
MTASLREFVAQTISDILDGVADVHKHPHGKHVAPHGTGGAKFSPDSGVITIPGGSLTFVRFDVAVTAESSDDTKVAGGLKVVVALSGSTMMSATSKNTEVTRVQFVVPLGLPPGDVQGSWP